MSRQEEKDAELDRRIVALRKKNQALLRRYQVSGLCQVGGPTGLALLGWPADSGTVVSPMPAWVWDQGEGGCVPSQRLCRGLGDSVTWCACPLVSHWCLSV